MVPTGLRDQRRDQNHMLKPCPSSRSTHPLLCVCIRSQLLQTMEVGFWKAPTCPGPPSPPSAFRHSSLQERTAQGGAGLRQPAHTSHLPSQPITGNYEQCSNYMIVQNRASSYRDIFFNFTRKVWLRFGVLITF